MCYQDESSEKIRTNKSLVNYSKLLKDVVIANVNPNSNVNASLDSFESFSKNPEETRQ